MFSLWNKLIRSAPPAPEESERNGASPNVETNDVSVEQRENANSTTTENADGNRNSSVECAGLDRKRFDDVISKRQWEEVRNKFSPVTFHLGTIRSVRCKKTLRNGGTVCSACMKAGDTMRALRYKQKKRPVSEESRIIYSGDRWLTEKEKKKKVQLILVRKKSQLRAERKKVAAAKREMETSKRELQRYRPRHEENREAARNLVTLLDRQADMSSSPLCLWRNENGDRCNVRMRTVDLLRDHVKDVHLQRMVDENGKRFTRAGIIVDGSDAVSNRPSRHCT